MALMMASMAERVFWVKQVPRAEETQEKWFGCFDEG
jgi:hypothetical protein